MDIPSITSETMASLVRFIDTLAKVNDDASLIRFVPVLRLPLHPTNYRFVQLADGTPLRNTLTSSLLTVLI